MGGGENGPCTVLSVRKHGGCSASRAKGWFDLEIESSPCDPPMDVRSRVTKIMFTHALCDENSSIGYASYGSRTHCGYFSHQWGFKGLKFLA